MEVAIQLLWNYNDPNLAGTLPSLPSVLQLSVRNDIMKKSSNECRAVDLAAALKAAEKARRNKQKA